MAGMAGRGGGCFGVAPLATEIRGYHRGKFWKFCVQSVAFGGKIALCFDSKQSVLLTQTFGHKWFSEVA